MDDDAMGFVDGVKHCFKDLPDPRVVGRCCHRLFDIIAIAILAVASGADEWTEIALFGRLRETWLRQFLELPNGIPSHDTFRRVFGLLNRRQFAACLLKWTRALAEATQGKLVAIDGKTLLRSHRRKAELGPLHLVTAWCSENGLTLAQVAVEVKSNEITAIPELLKLFKVKGCTVTIDAIGSREALAHAKSHDSRYGEDEKPANLPVFPRGIKNRKTFRFIWRGGGWVRDGGESHHYTRERGPSYGAQEPEYSIMRRNIRIAPNSARCTSAWSI